MRGGQYLALAPDSGNRKVGAPIMAGPAASAVQPQGQGSGEG